MAHGLCGWARRALVSSCLSVWVACSAADGAHDTEPAGLEPDAAPAGDVAPLPPGAIASDAARPSLCGRAGNDTVRDVFCTGAGGPVRGMAELQLALKLRLFASAEEREVDPTIADADRQRYASAVMLTHSTALSGELVSPINPRAFILTSNTVFAFARGVQQVEVAARDRDSGRFTFYLVSFRQACNGAAMGCKPGDLYTPSIETNWTQVALQDDEDLKNTPSDCRQCHQRGTDAPSLLMRELEGPWTHFFAPDPDPKTPFPEPFGDDLRHDFLEAKGVESYAGVPAKITNVSTGFTLESLVSPLQPLIFDGSKILNERWPWSRDGYATTPQRSATWDDNFLSFKRGEQLALPFYAPRATDPDKQAQLTAAYESWADGELPADQLPELADIFPDDPQTRAEIGLQTEPDASPVDLLIQACGSCHNDVLDPSISRVRFSIALARLDAGELEVAVARLEMPRHAAPAMPPAGRRALDADARARLIAYLKQTTRPADDDARLEHAAQAGMAHAQPPILHD